MNRFGSFSKPLMWFMALLLAAFVAGCGSGGGAGGDGGTSTGPGPGPSPTDTTPPTVSYTTPHDLAVDVAINRNITATFSEAMNAATITNATFTLTQGVTPVPAAVTYAGTVATLNPTSDLLGNTVFTATITTGAKDLAGNALAVDKTWTFTTGATAGAGPEPVTLGTAGNFVILSVMELTNVSPSVVTGDVGLTVASGALIGLTCAEVTGVIYSVNAAGPRPCRVKAAAMLTQAEIDGDNAFNDASARVADYTELGAGNIGGLNLGPATYKWSTGVQIPTDVTLTGGPNDVWIFQIGNGLIVSSGVHIILAGGALPQNVYWAPTWDVELGTNSRFNGVLVPAAAVFMSSGASINGRLLAFAVHLDNNTVTQPAP